MVDAVATADSVRTSLDSARLEAEAVGERRRDSAS
jgi:hypothetical protein